MATRTSSPWFMLALIAVLAVAGLSLQGTPVSAATVEPDFVPGNPTCEVLGYDFGYKPQPEPPPSGTYTFPGTSYSVEITSDGTYFDWTSTLGIDAVIVKGGPNANVYRYDPPAEAFSDTGLHSPTNASGGYAAISHIEFCYDYEVDVTKTADTTFTRTFGWTIDKTVVPALWQLFTGDSGTSEYTVAVTKDGGTDSDWAVSGDILIENNTPFAATITGVNDQISPSIVVPVDCGVDIPYELPPGGALTCTYSADLRDGSSRTNTATVTTEGIVGGGEDTADVIFGAPTTVVNDSINVDDTNGSSWEFTDSGSVTYEKTFHCDADAGTHENTATISETNASKDASVTVVCYALAVKKDADTAFDRNWTWTIEKSGDQTDLTLSVGQQFVVNYEVTVDAASTDSNWAVSGEIIIANPHPTIDAELTAVTDLVSPDIAATVDCPSLSVPAGGELICTYSTDLPDAESRINTATATLQNYDFASDGTATSDGTTNFTGVADVDFANATITEIDECIDVTDGQLEWEVCADEAPVTFTYAMTVGPYEVCGTYFFENTASFTTNDTGATGSASHTVTANVPCTGGCTLTQGYWKTHSVFGPAPYDDTWASLPNGASTSFFLSGQTYYDVLWTPPAGNVYYNLAHQYIAAELNFLNGADPTAAQAAFDAATDLFAANTPAMVASLKGKAAKPWTELASTLDQYNNGLIGPGHCSEEATAAAESPPANLPGTWVYLPLVER